MTYFDDEIHVALRRRFVSVRNSGIGGNVRARGGACVIVVALESGSEVERPIAMMDDLDDLVTEFRIPAGRQSVIFHDDSWIGFGTRPESTSSAPGTPCARA